MSLILPRDATLVPELNVLYEDNHLLVIDKPAGIATQGTTDGKSVYDLACAYIKQKYRKPGNVYLGIVSRLDTVTSGVLVLARTSKAASRLAAQFRQKSSRKIYHAVLEAMPGEESGLLVDHVRKDESQRRMVVCDASHSAAKRAELSYRVLATKTHRGQEATFVEVELMTGRKHQIRLQFSQRSCPIVGDIKYDASSKFGAGIALHSHRLTLEHPTKKEPITFEAGRPATWQTFGF